jgi:hypothetical protein
MAAKTPGEVWAARDAAARVPAVRGVWCRHLLLARVPYARLEARRRPGGEQARATAWRRAGEGPPVSKRGRRMEAAAAVGHGRVRRWR